MLFALEKLTNKNRASDALYESKDAQDTLGMLIVKITRKFLKSNFN